MNSILSWLGKNKWKVITGVIVVAFAAALLNRADAAEPDLAPLSVTQERLLDSGDVEVYYVYNNQRANGANDGSQDFGGLWAPFDFLTLGASTAYNGGFGDVFVHGTADVGDLFGFEVRPSVGLSIPNGFTNNGPLFDESSGTIDLVPALSLVGNAFASEGEGVELGAQWKGQFRLSENDFDFDIGDQHTVTGWAGVRPFEAMSVFGFVEADFIGDAGGLAPVGGSESVRVGAGTHVWVEGFRVSGEVAVPFHESYEGLRNGLDEARLFRVGVQRTF